ncbi:MAG: rhodanese-like domain-containing protein [Chloroflexi bacterium]|nr:rhodanese-like domain-containing protein [Chloroflexota bacterium]
MGTSPEEVVRLSPEDLNTLLRTGAKVTILDNRPESEYERSHIKGAVSLPWKERLTEDDITFPVGNPVVTYCDCGPGESDSALIAVQLLEMGFSDVKTLALGWSEWVKAGFPVE